MTSFVVVSGLVVTLRRHIDELLRAVELSARTDALTGVLNRRGFDEALVAQARRVRDDRTVVHCLEVVDVAHDQAQRPAAAPQATR